jgi:hypothetical protein
MDLNSYINNINQRFRLGIGKGLQGVEKEVNFDLFPTLAPLIDPKYNHQSMIDYVIIYKSNT